MTRDKQLEAIRSACINANPEIMQLGPDTKVNIWWMDQPKNRTNEPDETGVYVYEDRNGWRDNGEWEGKYRQCIEDNVMGYYEVLGRPIRLADVLLAVGYLGHDYEVENEHLRTWFLADNGHGPQNIWNLRQDDLTLQSDECVTFLAHLLG